jgi:hypothetical protein
MARVQITKTQIQHVVARARYTYILNFRRHFVVNDGFLVLTYYVDTQFQGVVLTKFMRFGFSVFGGQPLAVDERAV